MPCSTMLNDKIWGGTEEVADGCLAASWGQPTTNGLNQYNPLYHIHGSVFQWRCLVERSNAWITLKPTKNSEILNYDVIDISFYTLKTELKRTREYTGRWNKHGLDTLYCQSETLSSLMITFKWKWRKPIFQLWCFPSLILIILLKYY